MFERNQLEILKKRVKEKRKFIQAIIGPRQTGKTTLAYQLTKRIEIPFHFVSADAIPATDNSWIEQQWETARILLKVSGAKQVLLIIDEIQKIYNWSEEVKKQWDRDSFDDKNIKLIILGSSFLNIQKGLSESLMGRFEVIFVNHWSFNEMNNAFGFSPEEYAWFGGYPGAAELIKDEKRWKEYIQNAMIDSTISRDIIMLTRIDKPSLLRRLFELGCSYSGQILSYSKILGQLQDKGNSTTIVHYLSLLDSAGLLSGLEKFSKEKIRQKSSIPKWLVQNNALFSVAASSSLETILTQPDKWGRSVESAIGVYLLNSSKEFKYKLFYWRDNKYEIDFVLERNGKILGIEVKTGYVKKIKGAEEFKKRYNVDKLYLISETAFNWRDFLKTKPDELF
ncbi:MAG: ATP-binding protein [Ignavibacteria bacterium]